MSSLKDIPVVAEAAQARSGEKYLTPQGFTAIRDGIKARAALTPGTAAAAQAPVAARQGARRRGLQRGEGAREGAPPRHGVRGSQVPQHR